MATQAKTVDELLKALAPLQPQARKMFGEYGLYLDGKIIGSLADDQLFVKVTPVGLSYLDESHLCPAYPGAKPSLRVPDARWGEGAWLRSFLQATADALPLPPPKKPKKGS
jgi:TfoX/Sxy family transcriptional regulator of competence genes